MFLHSNWITLKMSERLRQGGRFKRKRPQVMSYESKEIEYYTSCLSQAVGELISFYHILICVKVLKIKEKSFQM